VLRKVCGNYEGGNGQLRCDGEGGETRDKKKKGWGGRGAEICCRGPGMGRLGGREEEFGTREEAKREGGGGGVRRGAVRQQTHKTAELLRRNSWTWGGPKSPGSHARFLRRKAAV